MQPDRRYRNENKAERPAATMPILAGTLLISQEFWITACRYRCCEQKKPPENPGARHSRSQDRSRSGARIGMAHRLRDHIGILIADAEQTEAELIAPIGADPGEGEPAEQ